MKALITGAGRGGTNLLCEFVRATGKFIFSENVEDRSFFKYREIPKHYGTKLATENKDFDIINISRMVHNHPDLFIFFSIRHPIDCCLSKIYRGRPKKEGGDCSKIPPDGTLTGSIFALKHMFHILTFLQQQFSDRVFIFKMEDLILDTENQCRKICEIVNVEMKPSMLEAYKNNRNKNHQKRYNGKLDNSQIDLYTKLENSFDGYFLDKKNYITKIKKQTIEICKYLSYSV